MVLRDAYLSHSTEESQCVESGSQEQAGTYNPRQHRSSRGSRSASRASQSGNVSLLAMPSVVERSRRRGSADYISSEQSNFCVTDVCHLLFTLSGNSPKKFLEANNGLVHKEIKLRLCGLRVKEHKAFVKDLFDTRNSFTYQESLEAFQ